MVITVRDLIDKLRLKVVYGNNLFEKEIKTADISSTWDDRMFTFCQNKIQLVGMKSGLHLDKMTSHNRHQKFWERCSSRKHQLALLRCGDSRRNTPCCRGRSNRDFKCQRSTSRLSGELIKLPAILSLERTKCQCLDGYLWHRGFWSKEIVEMGRVRLS